LKGHTSYVTSVVFNHDGTKIVSGSRDNTIRVWNVDTGECISTLKCHTRDVFSVRFNHDGTKIVSGSDDETIKVWEMVKFVK
jgi:WD40 repeat protein